MLVQVLLALAFSGSPHVAPGVLRPQSSVPTVHMRGWQDPWADSMRQGKNERMPAGRSDSKFEQQLEAQNYSELQKLGVATAAMLGAIAVILGVQISQL
jgi:hypothetical protein